MTEQTTLEHRAEELRSSPRTEAEARAHRACAAYQASHKRFIAHSMLTRDDNMPVADRVAADLEYRRLLAESTKLKMAYDDALDALSHRVPA